MLSLDPSMHRRAKRKAADLGISLSEYMRRLIDADLGTEERPAAHTSEIFELAHSSGTNVARDKDQLTGEAVTALRGRSSAV